MNRSQALARFELLQHSLQQLLSELDQLHERILYHKPAPDKWSITQICYHLHFVESGSISYVKKKMLGGDSLKSTGIGAVIRFTFLKWLLLSGYRTKVPKALGDVPEELNYADLIRSWNETRKNLKALIETIPEKLMIKEIYRQPRAGRLNLMQMLGFFQDHFDHHLKQINHLRASKKIS